MIIDQNLIAFVKRTIIVSNTPAFLYNSIRDFDAVLLFSNSVSSSELIDELRNISNNSPRTKDEIAIVYLILACLSFKADYDPKVLTEMKFDWVEWYSNFLSFLLMNNNSSNSVKVEPVYSIPQPNYSKVSEASANYESINIQPKERES